MPHLINLKKLSFLVYGLGSSGQSVVRFFKKKNINNYKVWDDKDKIIAMIQNRITIVDSAQPFFSK